METTAYDLVRHLRERGVVLTVNGDRINYRAPAGTLTDADKASLAAHKREILDYLLTETPPKPSFPHGCGSTRWWWRAVMTEKGPRGDWLCAACHPPFSEPAPSVPLTPGHLAVPVTAAARW